MYSEKWNAVKKFLNNSKNCRMNLLVSYFGEKSKEKCGICDICILARKEKESKGRINKAKTRIVSYLGNNNRSTQEILGVFSSTEVLFAQEALRILLDEGIIVRYKNTANYCLEINE
jgi:ATP-dependent DNA helicase RecQ